MKKLAIDVAPISFAKKVGFRSQEVGREAKDDLETAAD
jgi:hypothetical protein